jgi:hypothetical protein
MPYLLHLWHSLSQDEKCCIQAAAWAIMAAHNLERVFATCTMKMVDKECVLHATCLHIDGTYALAQCDLKGGCAQINNVDAELVCQGVGSCDTPTPAPAQPSAVYHFPKIIFVPTPAPMLNTTVIHQKEEGPNWLLIWIVILLLLLLLAILMYILFGRKKYWIEAGPGYLRSAKRSSSAFINSASIKRFTGRATPGGDSVVMVSTNRTVQSPRILSMNEYRNQSPTGSQTNMLAGGVQQDSFYTEEQVVQQQQQQRQYTTHTTQQINFDSQQLSPQQQVMYTASMADRQQQGLPANML